jgi:hypothetical protein
MLMDGEFDHLLKGVNAKRMAAKRASGEYRQPINPPLKNPAALSKNCPHCGAFATRCAGDEPRRHAMICKVTGKVLKKWPAKPRGGFVIVARSKAGPARTLYYTKKHRRFSDDPKDRPTVYPNTAIAHATGLKLLKHYSILDRHTVTVEPVAGRGAKKNPRGKTRGPGSGVTFDEWMTRVDGVVLYLAGVSVHDLPDIPFRDMYDNGSSPSAAAKKAIKRARYDNPRKRELSVFDRHRKKIALDTLKMSDVGARIMGGMTKAEAIEFLQTIGYRFPKR